MKYPGGCHCGAIRVSFTTALEPTAIEVRACQCSFCRKHAACAVADPAGLLEIEIAPPVTPSLYEFGLLTARYVVCRTCGVYVAALTKSAPMRGIAIVNALDAREAFTAEARPVDYSVEDVPARVARRQYAWTPASLDCAAR